AHFHGLRSLNEILTANLGTSGGGDLSRRWVNRGADNSGGRAELGHVAILAVLVGAAHEFGPNRERGFGAFELDIAIVVKADPDYADQLAGEAREPAVVGSPGLAGGWEIDAARVDAGAGSAAEHLFEQVVHQKHDARVQHGMMFGL